MKKSLWVFFGKEQERYMLQAIQKHTCSISTITGQTFGVEERRVEPETMAKERHINVAFFVFKGKFDYEQQRNSEKMSKCYKNITKVF